MSRLSAGADPRGEGIGAIASPKVNFLIITKRHYKHFFYKKILIFLTLNCGIYFI